TLAHWSESDPRRCGDERLFDQKLRELERPARSEPLRNRRPHEHRGAWRFNRPSSALQPLHQHVAAALVRRGELRGLGLAFPQPDDRRNLNRLKIAVIEIALDTP